MSSSSGTSAIEIFREARGRGVFSVIAQGLAGWFSAIGIALISGAQTIADFLLLPFVLFIDVARASVEGFFIAPARLPLFGLEESARALVGQGLAALPISTSVALGTLLLVIAFLALSITSNVIPGLTIDNPIWDRFFGTPEEEFDDED